MKRSIVRGIRSLPAMTLAGRLAGKGAAQAIPVSDLAKQLQIGQYSAGGGVTYTNGTGLGLTGHTFSLTAPVTVALGGTNATSASGTALDNITGFSSTGYLKRTGAGTYSFVADGTAHQILHGGGTFAAVDLASADVTGILPVANGGTNNAFFTVSGPASSAKTYTVPNASTTILTTNAAVTVGQGGTGIASGTNGGIPAFTGTGTIASSGLLGAGNVMVGGGSGVAPSTISNGQLPATATNDDASSGKVGEYVESIVLIASAIALTPANTVVNITSISLTAGDWDVYAELWTTGGSGMTNVRSSINTTTAVLATVPATGTSRSQTFPGADGTNDLPVGMCRATLSGTTTYYFNASCNWTVSAPSGYGKLYARRVR